MRLSCSKLVAKLDPRAEHPTSAAEYPGAMVIVTHDDALARRCASAEWRIVAGASRLDEATLICARETRLCPLQRKVRVAADPRIWRCAAARGITSQSARGWPVL